MSNKLKIALENIIWVDHSIGDKYNLINRNGSIDRGWKIAYYPIFEDGKTGVTYNEPRALVEKPISNGIDFREVSLRFLIKTK